MYGAYFFGGLEALLETDPPRAGKLRQPSFTGEQRKLSRVSKEEFGIHESLTFRPGCYWVMTDALLETKS